MRRQYWMKHHWLVVFFVICLLTLSGCADADGVREKQAGADPYKATDTWTVYWYICGTDLESEGGAATADVQELLEATLPENVRVILQTGGSKQWQNNVFPNGAVGRYVYDSQGLRLVEALPDADMGSRDTLRDFLRFGKEKYPADHQVFVFWDHGGGSAAGVCYDERTGHMLSLDDLRSSFQEIWQSDEKNPPFELIGFDACLMASIDTAKSLQGFTRYMTASEELEPGNGWEYSGWMGALAKNPAMGGKTLGKAICDSYMEGCQRYGTAGDATLSVIDMAALPQLNSAYEAYGKEALQRAVKEPQTFFSAFGRHAQIAENYGGNTPKQGYANMVDLGDLVKNSRAILPENADKLLQALDACVVYKVNGVYRPNGKGISGYYSYNGDTNGLMAYLGLNASSLPVKCLYYYQIFGELPAQAANYLSSGDMASGSFARPTAPQKLFQLSSLEDLAVDVDKDGAAFVQLTPEQTENLSSVHCQFVYMNVEQDALLYLGSDADINADWDKGVFKDNFQGTWPMLDGHPVYIEISQETDDYNLYSVPILLNGMECNLQVAYSFKDSAWHILGARKEIGSNGAAERNLIQLKAGDRITTLHYGMTISGNEEEFKQFEMDTFAVTAQTHMADEKLEDGTYGYCFEFIDPANESALSKMAMYTIKNGNIVTEVE